ncbi:MULTISPECIES: phenylacetate--CoA ligase family protein [Streptomycetaceae]|uniref:Phenylacetate-CoA ligase n=1 Tax=Streptantibioticus cattleyicolor (strain ATCC 35852 / DSM 46488 / JCM 4925 / NBRC 14057 / NRRL 8057) TaxID=1003195 RepID=F8K1M1_STREN|nr:MULTISPECIES: phenylacetate--CoA ligase family protein [Streptomycetaceae]AEW95055.1 hypothetical protein SCATT_26840 [Streptantibioticus cattleyicolor NRRL 8057 = DSM 46488]MYS59651.1 phenylacetate--CoA ligase family protein [Streptomyces sp. SID5468]CCB75404.1 conserved protein of unknown function [Streptantibioticus cattleyicolor NRRL 8057 = DSM 46488]
MYTIYHPELDALVRRLRDDHETFLAGKWDAARLARHQTDLVRATVAYVKEHSAFYRGHLAGVDPERITALDEATMAAIPFTTKDDLRAAQQDMLSRPLADAWIFYETTGTTGRSTPCPRDNTDSLHNNAALTHYYESVFRRYGDGQVIGVAGPTDLHAFSDTFGDVCRNLGLSVAKMWPHSPTVGFDRALNVMRSFPITGLFCTPGMAMTLAKRVFAAGLDPRRDFAVDVVMTTGELASPSMLANLGEIWGADAYNALYASQEASVKSAVAGDGRMYTVPLIAFNEVIDPVTGAWVAPDASGVREGELVVTHLYQGSKPLIRYRTGDLVRLTDPGPDAAVPAPALEALGRVRDRLDINGRPITGYDLENLLLRHIRGYLDYQIVLDHADGADRVTLNLQLTEDAPALDTMADAFRAAVADCRDVLGADLGFTATELGAITTTGAMVSWKAARLVDRRGTGDDASAPDAEQQAAAAIAAGRSR